MKPALSLMLALATGPVLAAGPVPRLPAVDFAKAPEIRQPILSPDGKHLAAVLIEGQSKGTDARFQLVVFDLPGLQVASRLDFHRNLLPGGITWVSNTRLVVAEARQSGTLDFPTADGNILALDFDGKQQRELYSTAGWGNPGTPFNVSSMVHGYPAVVGATDAMNGHVFLSITPFPHNTGMRNGGAQRTLLYDVNSMDGYPKQVAEIDHGDMSFLVDHDVALFASGSDAQGMPAVYSRSDGQSQWQRMAPAQVGEVFEPLRVTPDGKHLYALYSAKGGPAQLVETDFSGSDRKVLASNDFGSVADLWHTPNHHQPFAVTFAGVYSNGKPAVTYLLDDRYASIMQALNKQFGDHFVGLTSISKDGNTILVHAVSGNDPGEYALLDAKNMQLRPLFQSEPWIKPGQIGPRMPFQFHNRNGLLLDGYLTFPVGVAHEGLPTVVLVHGGPIGIRDQWYYDPLQLAPFLANRGYAVLNVNYRGSSGRGLAFQHSGWRQYGTGIQDDIVDAVHWAIRKGYADPQRICVFGASFGGYSSLMQPIVAPGLYKCAIDYAGVSDMTIEQDRSVYSHEATGNVFFKQAIGTREDAKAISPLFMLDRFNVPVLIAQGGADNIVPPQNAERLRDALEAAHKPYQWLYYPEEYHGFQTEPHRVALLQKMQAFLTEYLGPGVTATGASRP